MAIISDQEEALAIATPPLPRSASVDECLSAITWVLPGQHLAYLLALAGGYNPEHPRGVCKVTRGVRRFALGNDVLSSVVGQEMDQ